MVWGGTFWVAAFVAAAAAEASADQPSRQVPAAFQFSGAPLLRSGPSHVSLVGDRLGISERVLLGSSLNPSLSRQARLVGYSFAGPKRSTLCISMQAEGEEAVGPVTDSLIVLPKTAEIGVVQKVGEDGKCEVLMQTKKTRKIKAKDMMVIHPGPVRSWELYETLESPMKATATKIKEVYDFLAVDSAATDVKELSTLLFGSHSPGSSWSAWKIVSEDLYFHGTPEEIYPYEQERVKSLVAQKKREAKESKEKEEMMQRIKENALTDEDHETRLGDVVDFAMGLAPGCALLKEIGIEQTPENAHRMLLEWGHWDERVCPWATRSRVNLKPHTLDTPALPKEERRDMTSMASYAIDQEGTKDADDAISIAPDGKFWVHVADVAALVAPDSPLELEARGRGASVYLPEGTVHMLPNKLVMTLGLGQQARSPALSFGFRLGEGGELSDIEVCKSTIKAKTMTYEEAHQAIETLKEPWLTMYKAAMTFRTRREASGAVEFQFPQSEVTVTDRGDTVDITELPLLTSKELVMEFMVMAGEAAATFAADNDIPFLFATQPAPEAPKPEKATRHANVKAAAEALAAPSADEMLEATGPPRTLSEMFQAMRTFQRSSMKTAPGRHHSLGMDAYSQVTSPLRRYGDLLAHQQLRAYLGGGKGMLTEEQLLERVKASEETVGRNKKAERMSKQHWTLVWLSRQENWEGLATCIDVRQTRPGGPRIATVFVQELGFMCQVKLKKDVRLDADVFLQLVRVRLPELRADLVQNVPTAELYGTDNAEQYRAAMKARKNVGTRLSISEKRGGG